MNSFFDIFSFNLFSYYTGFMVADGQSLSQPPQICSLFLPLLKVLEALSDNDGSLLFDNLPLEIFRLEIAPLLDYPAAMCLSLTCTLFRRILPSTALVNMGQTFDAQCGALGYTNLLAWAEEEGFPISMRAVARAAGSSPSLVHLSSPALPPISPSVNCLHFYFYVPNSSFVDTRFPLAHPLSQARASALTSSELFSN